MKNQNVLTLEDVKTSLRIDLDYTQEDTDLQMRLDASREYIIDAVGCCDESKAKVKIAVLALVAFMYDNRSMVLESDAKVNKIIQSITFQEWVGNIGQELEGDTDGG